MFGDPRRPRTGEGETADVQINNFFPYVAALKERVLHHASVRIS